MAVISNLGLNNPNPQRGMAQRVVWMMSGWYPTPEKPGHGLFIRRQALAASAFCPVGVAVAGGNVHQSEPYRLLVTTTGNLTEVVVTYKRSPRTVPLWSLLLRFPRWLSAYRRAFRVLEERTGRPSLLHLHIAFPLGVLAWWVSRWYKVPLIISEQWSGYYPQDGRFDPLWVRLPTRWALARAALVMPVSEHLASAMRERGVAGPFRVVPNVVDGAAFPLRTRPPESGPPFRLLHVSALNDHEKNVSGILRVAQRLIQKGYKIELRLVGDHPERVHLQQVAHRLGLDAHAQFLGFLPPAALAHEYASAHLMVMFSWFETFSCVLAEAVGAGLPVVATRTGGIPEWLQDGDGLLVEPGDEPALERAIESMMALSEPMVPRNSEALRRRFSPEQVGKQLFAAYQHVWEMRS